MGRKGPLLTLLAGGALAAVLLLANSLTTGEPDEPAATGDRDAVTPAASATPVGSPAPTGTPAATGGRAEAGQTEPTTYVGYVDGGGASVAIVITGAEATAYVCDGAAVEAWLTGDATAGELTLTGENGSLTGSYDGQTATGTVTADGREWSFTVESVAPPEGLYRFADTVAGGAEVDGGWIVLPDGTQVGLLTVDGRPRPAPPLDPVTGEVEVDGETVTTRRQG